MSPLLWMAVRGVVRRHFCGVNHVIQTPTAEQVVTPSDGLLVVPAILFTVAEAVVVPLHHAIALRSRRH